MGTCGGERTRRTVGPKDSSPLRRMRTFGKLQYSDHDEEVSAPSTRLVD